jgi:hypothetical protein
MSIEKKVSLDVKHITNYLEEEDVDWGIQNQIHKVLNYSFDGLSTKFIAKTYGYERPTHRILGWEKELVVGHMAVCDDTLHLKEKNIRVCKLGLWATDSSTKGWGTEICRASMECAKNLGYEVAIGMTSNSVIINYIVPKFGNKIALLDLRIQGKQYTSKVDTIFMLFNINLQDEEFERLKQDIADLGVAKIDGEPF